MFSNDRIVKLLLIGVVIATGWQFTSHNDQNQTSRPGPITLTYTRDTMHCLLECLSRESGREETLQILSYDDIRGVAAKHFDDCECTDVSAVLILRGRDGWGTPWRVDSDGSNGWLVSAGPDRIFNDEKGSDDLKKMLPLSIGGTTR